MGHHVGSEESRGSGEIVRKAVVAERPGLRPPQPCALRADADAFRLHNHNLAYLDPLTNLYPAFRSLVLALLQLLIGTYVTVGDSGCPFAEPPLAFP